MGRIPPASGEIDLRFAAYRVPRERTAEPILDDIRKLVPSIDDEVDPDGSTAVAEAVFDRIDALAGVPRFSAVLSGAGSVALDDPTSACVLFSPDAPADPAGALVASGGRLTRGGSMAASQRSRSGSFALIELGGPRSGGFVRALDQLRREHRLALGGAVRGERDAEETETYAERDQRLRKTRALAIRFGEQALRRPVATRPLGLMLSGHLLGRFSADGQPGKDMLARFEGLRQALYDELGFRVPEIGLTQAGRDLAQAEYGLQVWGARVVKGEVELDHVFVNETVDRLHVRGIIGKSAVNPANGNECAWIRSHAQGIAEDAGLVTWDALGYVVLHLHGVVRKNGASFFTPDMAASLLKDASVDLHRRVHQAPGGVVKLTTVLRSLLAEEVSIRAIGSIAEEYLGLLAGPERPPAELSEQIRNGETIRPYLQQKYAAAPLWELGPNFVEMLRCGVMRHGHGRVLALEPDSCQDMLSAVRAVVSKLEPTAANPVVMVDDWRLRPHLRRLIELEFPHLWVLARREIRDPQARMRIAVIETGADAS
jgi:flagellar biosynthesis component FlhA